MRGSVPTEQTPAPLGLANTDQSRVRDLSLPSFLSFPVAFLVLSGTIPGQEIKGSQDPNYCMLHSSTS